MPRDAQGLPLASASGAAAAAFDHALERYARYRLDAFDVAGRAVAADPEAPLPQILFGAFRLFANRADLLPEAAAHAASVERLAAGTTPRERAHAAAYAAWVADDMDRALAHWDAILAEYPRDLLAFRLHHHTAFWHGERTAMLRVSTALLPHWDAGVPGWHCLLGCHAFACEENGDLRAAEAAGRDAVAGAPDDLWAVHAVAHVLEMQDRRADGLAWIDANAAAMAGGNAMRHHLARHQALHHLEQDDLTAALHVYDHGVRDLDDPLTRQMPDLATDIQNAASLLFRLELRGVAVGDRWQELADKAETRIGDCRSVFTLPHWMLALTQAGRIDAAGRFLQAMRDFAARGQGASAAAVARAALPACEALLHRAVDQPEAALAALRPALDELGRLGGSHAQRDLFDQLLLDLARRAGSAADAELARTRASRFYAQPAAHRRAYALVP